MPSELLGCQYSHSGIPRTPGDHSWDQDLAGGFGDRKQHWGGGRALSYRKGQTKLEKFYLLWSLSYNQTGATGFGKTLVCFPSSSENHIQNCYKRPSIIMLLLLIIMFHPRGTSGKEPACQSGNRRAAGFYLWVRKIPGEGNGNPLQYSCLETPMDKGVYWQSTVQGYRVGHNWSDLEQLLHRPLFWELLRKFSSVQFSRSVVSDSATAWTTAHQASLSIINSQSPPKPMSIESWYHLTISSSAVPFSSCPQSFPASGSFQMSQLFELGGQSIGVSASTSVLPMNTQDWSPLGWTGWISL